MTSRRTALGILGMTALTCLPTRQVWSAPAFDHQHTAWTALLRRHVVLINSGTASQLNYAGVKVEHAALKSYLASLSQVNQPVFQSFNPRQQMAFLINAYNAFTVELILTQYPKLKSIKDLGGLLSSPWKKKFIPLLGTTMTLDGIEHDLLRQPGRYDDPRIHFSVNCASIGCPMLREEAFVAEQLDTQLDQQAKRFLSDRSRNRYNPAKRQLEVSQIFDWYGDDFKQGFKGISSVAAYLAGYAEQLADAPGDRRLVDTQRANVSYLSYDWALNDVKRGKRS